MTKKPLSVVQILPALDGGGVERGTLEVAEALVQEGHRSLVISAGGRLVEPLEAAGSRHVTWPVGKKTPLTLRWVRPLRKLLRDEQVDILHARSRMPAWIAYFAWRSLPSHRRPRFVTTVHGLYSVNQYSSIMTRGEAVVAVSETIQRYILESYPRTDPGRVRLIFRGADPVQFPHGHQPPPEWKRQFAQDFPQLAGRRVLMLPGRMTRLKGHADFLELIAELTAAGMPVHGLIVGGVDPRRTAYAAEIRSLVKSLGIESNVTMTGHRSDVRECYAMSDVVLSLSHKPESFGRTVLESLSLGVPVVGYAHGGVGEILSRVFPAGAVPPGDRRRLVECVCELLCVDSVEVPPLETFRLEQMLRETLGLYEQLAA